MRSIKREATEALLTPSEYRSAIYFSRNQNNGTDTRRSLMFDRSDTIPECSLQKTDRRTDEIDATLTAPCTTQPF